MKQMISIVQFYIWHKQKLKPYSHTAWSYTIRKDRAGRKPSLFQSHSLKQEAFLLKIPQKGQKFLFLWDQAKPRQERIASQY